MADFRLIFQRLKSHPRLYLVDSSLVAVVSFIYGCDAATEGRLLKEFDEWVARKLNLEGHRSLSWVSMVAGQHDPLVLEGVRNIGEMSAAAQELTLRDIFAHLDGFFVERSTSID